MPIVLRSLTRRALAILAVGGLLGASVVVLGSPAPAEAATFTVTGTVYRDFDGDGTHDTGNTGLSGIQNDAGVAGVTVTATDAVGGGPWTATTDANGGYTLSVVDPSTTKLRLSFSTPSPFKPSAHGSGNATSVQFIDVATSPTVANYAVNVPEDYAQNSPPLVTAIQYSGLSNSTSLADSPTLAATPWSQNYTLADEPDWDTANYPGRTTLAKVPQTGSVWGTAYDTKTDALFAAATYKRHSGLGPLGLGGIYRVSDVLTAAGAINSGSTVSSWLNVTTLSVSGTPINVGTVPVDGAGGRGLGAPESPARDVDAFANAGKVGIGGIAVDPAAGKLYFVNLFDKKIYGVDIANPTTVAVTSYDPGFTVGQRPWALTIYRGTLYVGYVDSGETAADGDNPGIAASTAGLQYHVKAASLASPTIWSGVLDGSLGYAKGQVAPDPSAQEIRWNNWTDSWTWTGANAGSVAVTVAAWGNGNAQIYPQAVLTDLAFDTDGYLILGIEDRTAIQGGNRNYRAQSGTTTLYETFSNGDLLLASPDGDGTFTPENNGVVGARTTTSGQGGQGPGGLEFFNDRQALGNGAFHQEIGLGAIAPLAGSSHVAATTFDPLVDIRVAGQNWLSLTTGAIEAGYQHNLDTGGTATSTGTFQKAGGLGDIDVIALLAPLEIGNRVWFDGDRDGVQDADEPAAPGVTVELLQGTTVIGTTTTSAAGEYYFSSASNALLTPSGGAYTVRFTTPSTGSLYSGHPVFGTVAWNDVNFTTPNAPLVADTLDSDAVVTSQHVATIAYTAGGPGDNDHTLDAGLIADASFSVTKAIDPTGATPVIGATFDMTAQARDFRGTVIALGAADASFALASGDTKTITLPAGSDALVAETSTAGISSTTVSPASWFDVAGTAAAPTVVTVTNRLYLPGKFTLSKAVTGTGASLVTGSTSFTVEYSTDGGSAWTPVTVTPSTPVPAITLPYGTNVLLREATPPAVAGVTWGIPAWGGTGVTTVTGNQGSFVIGDGTTVAVTLTNPATRNNGSFTVTKSVSGTGATLVPGATSFTVEYSTDAGSTWTPMTVAAGVTTSAVLLPYGTAVQLRETTPAAITGATWGAPAWSGTGVTTVSGTARFTIGDGTTVAVALGNPTTRNDGSFTVTKSLTGDATDLGSARSPFTVEYSINAGASWTPISIASGATSAPVTLPFGTSVTIRETEPADVAGMTWGDPSWTVDSTPVVGSTATFTIGDATNVAIGLENPTTRHTGTFDVRKSLSGDAVDLVPGVTSFTVQYSTTNGLIWNSLAIAAGSTSSTVTLPFGTHVLLREATPSAIPGLDWDDPIWTGVDDNGDGTASFDIGDDTHVAVGIDNPTVRHDGDFTIAKTLSGDATDLGATAGPFVVEYTTDGGSTWTPISIAAGATSPAVTLPYATVVTVRETAPASVSGMSWGTPIWTGAATNPDHSATFTIGDRTTIAVAVENPTTLVKTGFSVTKSVTGDAEPSVPNSFGFTVNYSYTDAAGAHSGSLTLSKNSPTASVGDVIPVGTVVTLSEVAPSGAPADVSWLTPKFTGDATDNGDGTATFVAGLTSTAIDLENPTEQLVGDLRISKSVTGSALGSVPAGFDFTVHYSYGATSGDLTIEDGGSALLTGVPAGTVVTLSEAARVGGPADVQWETPIWRHGSVTDTGTTTVTVGSGTEVQVDLENPTTRLFNGFSLTKVVSGDAADSVPDDFEFTVTYSPAGTPAGPLVLTKAAPSASVTGLPLGTVVTLTETAPGNAAPDVVWGAPVFTGTTFTNNPDGSVSFTITAAPIAVVLTNPTTRLYGDFSITKDVTGPAEDTLDDDFEFSGTYSYPGISAVPFTIENGQTWTLPSADRIPAGTVVTVTETTPIGGLPSLSGWGTPVFSGTGVAWSGPGSATFVIGANTTLAVGLENPTTVTPQVDIEKGDGAGSVIAHDADTMPLGEHYEPGETRTIVFRVTNTGTEDLRQVLLTDDTLSGADVESITWAFPDGSTATAALVGENWEASWAATFGSGTSFWAPGDVIIGTATLTVDAADDAHVDLARVDAVGRFSGTAVEDEDAYNAFTGDIQVIKYDGRLAGPAVQSGGDWVIPAKPLANPYQDANDDAHAAQSIANVPVRIDWVVTNIGTTTLTDVMVTDTTLLGPSIDVWTCDLSDVGGPAVYSFLEDGPWAGLLAPSASFFCTGSVTLTAGGKHTDRADVEAHVVFPEVDGDGLPTGRPMLDGDDLPVLALDDQGHPIVVDDDDPFLDPAAVDLAFTGVEPWMPVAAGIAILSVILGVLAVALPRRRRSVARHR